MDLYSRFYIKPFFHDKFLVAFYFSLDSRHYLVIFEIFGNFPPIFEPNNLFSTLIFLFLPIIWILWDSYSNFLFYSIIFSLFGLGHVISDVSDGVSTFGPTRGVALPMALSDWLTPPTLQDRTCSPFSLLIFSKNIYLLYYRQFQS